MERNSPRLRMAGNCYAEGESLPGSVAGAPTVPVAVNNSPYVQMGTIEVPKALEDGEKFIKWDEVSLNGILVSSRLFGGRRMFSNKP